MNSKYAANTLNKQAASESKNDATLFQIDIQSGEKMPIFDDGFKEIGKMCYSPDGKSL